MKKTLIALAALAAAGAASAQSSVTILGVVDAGWAHQSGSASSASWRNRIVHNNTATTAIHFRGVEDLGGGLKALFQAELDWNPTQSSTANAGAFTGTPFNGEQYVGLAGGFGSVKLGTPNAAALEVNGMMQPFGTAMGSGYSAAFGRLDAFGNGAGINQVTGGAAGTNRIIRHERTARYDTPVIAGFTGSLEYSFGNDNAAAGSTLNNERYTALGLKYAAGPLNVGFAHSRTSEGGVTSLSALPANGSVKWNQIAVNYNFGFATVYGGFTTTKASIPAPAIAPNSRSWNVAIKAPIGAFDLMANYVHIKDRSAVVYADETPSVLGLGVDYNLSKRSAIYARYEAQRLSATPAGMAGRNLNTWAVGIRHAF